MLLAGEAVRDVQPDGVTAGCKAQVLTRLRAAMIDAALPPRTRLQAGLIASDLGDRPADLDEMVSIQGEAQFKIGKYPVTNHQYRRFIEEGGYGNERWWSKEGLRYKQQYDWTEPRLWHDEPFNRATQPVVGVSWYEAEAYCKWLTARWRGAGVISQQERVRLPTQEEWMAAARGGRPAPADESLDYPWRSPFDPAFANTKESDLKQTSPVHLYPQGVTATGVWDMAGNVWEWTEDLENREWRWADVDILIRTKEMVGEIQEGENYDVAWAKGGSWHTTAKFSIITSSVEIGRLVGLVGNEHLSFRVVVVPIACNTTAD